MRLKKIIIIFLCSLCLLNCSKQNTSLHEAKDNSRDRSTLQGKWVILNYWATWCEACIKEVPELNYFYHTYVNKNILLFGVNYDQLSSADLQKAIQKMQITYPVLTEEPCQLGQLNQTSVLPTTYIISPGGSLVKKIIGPLTAGDLFKIMSAFFSQDRE
ncbi:MAG: resA 2 [Gammaproteobacteria bacterium]|jgi:thiol-disulfide isomerase/thioredoxin|nr:resA 2 [Gammaproteobacteria bacterium]